MANKTHLGQLKRVFGFLLDSGFTISMVDEFKAFDNWIAIFESPTCRLQMLEDRGEVSLFAGPPSPSHDWKAGPWYIDKVLLDYLPQIKGSWKELFRVGTTEEQLVVIAELLQQYESQICNLFSPEAFPEHRASLERLQKEFTERQWAKLKSIKPHSS